MAAQTDDTRTPATMRAFSFAHPEAAWPRPPPETRSLLIQERRDDFASFLAADDWHDLEGGSCPSPLEHPLLQQPQVLALHQLEAATEIGFHPAVDVLQTVREQA